MPNSDLKWVRDPVLDSWTAKPYHSQRTYNDVALLYKGMEIIGKFSNHSEAKQAAEIDYQNSQQI